MVRIARAKLSHSVCGAQTHRRGGWRCCIRAAATLLLAALFAGAGRAQSTAVAAFGLVGPEPGEKRAAVLDLEYRGAPWRFGIGPAVGVSANSDGAAYLRAGFTRDFPFARRWNANVTMAAGAYVKGHGKDLGRGLEFRSALDVSFEVSPGMRLGAALAHLSNAGVSKRNPGIETLTLTLAFTPTRMTRRR